MEIFEGLFGFWVINYLLLKVGLTLLNCSLHTLAILLSSAWFSLKSVRATTAAVFLCTKVPNFALFWTIAYGISSDLQRVGKNTTVSIGSTSAAIRTSLAFFCSTRYVTWLRPNLRLMGLSPFLAFLSFTCSWAAALSLSAFSFLVSGEYFLRILKSWEATLITYYWWLYQGDWRIEQ